MKKEVMEFLSQQQSVTVCNGGKQALVLINERKEERLTRQNETDGEINDSLSSEPVAFYIYDGYWLDTPDSSKKGVVNAAKRVKIKEIEEYDSSSSVNGIIINGQSVWIDKNTRMGLRQNISDKKAINQANITMWMDGTPITLSCDEAEAFMCRIENYAYDCFNVTAKHKAEIESMAELSEILLYDVTSDYPDKVEITLK